MVLKVLFFMLFTLFTQKCVTATLMPAFHDSYGDMESTESTSQTTSPASVKSSSCSPDKVIGGFTYFSVNQFSSCAASNNKACPVGATSCSTDSCSFGGGDGLIKVAVACGSLLNGLESVSESIANGNGFTTSCPNGKQIIFGYVTQNTPSNPGACPENNKLCTVASMSCSANSCNPGSSTLQSIRLLCGTSEQTSSILNNATPVLQKTIGSAPKFDCSGEGSRDTMLMGVRLLFGAGLSSLLEEGICEYESGCPSIDSLEVGALALAAGLCVAPSSSPASTPKPEVSPTSSPSTSPTKSPTKLPTASPTQSPTGTGDTYNPSSAPTSAPSTRVGATQESSSTSSGDGFVLGIGISVGIGACCVAGGIGYATINRKRDAESGISTILKPSRHSSHGNNRKNLFAVSNKPIANNSWGSVDASQWSKPAGPAPTSASDGTQNSHGKFVTPIDVALRHKPMVDQPNLLNTEMNNNVSKNLRFPVGQRNGSFQEGPPTSPSYSKFQTSKVRDVEESLQKQSYSDDTVIADQQKPSKGRKQQHHHHKASNRKTRGGRTAEDLESLPVILTRSVRSVGLDV